jgi:rod shape determining protein RodA
MWSHQALKRIDFRTVPIILGLMVMSILIIASTTSEFQLTGEELFFTPSVKNQVQRFGVGILCFLFFAGLDYHKLREWAWILYLLTILLLLGLFFTEPIQHVHRWYRIPFVGGGLSNLLNMPSSPSFLLSVGFLKKKGGVWAI